MLSVPWLTNSIHEGATVRCKYKRSLLFRGRCKDSLAFQGADNLQPKKSHPYHLFNVSKVHLNRVAGRDDQFVVCVVVRSSQARWEHNRFKPLRGNPVGRIPFCLARAARLLRKACQPKYKKL